MQKTWTEQLCITGMDWSDFLALVLNWPHLGSLASGLRLWLRWQRQLRGSGGGCTYLPCCSWRVWCFLGKEAIYLVNTNIFAFPSFLLMVKEQKQSFTDFRKKEKKTWMRNSQKKKHGKKFGLSHNFLNCTLTTIKEYHVSWSYWQGINRMIIYGVEEIWDKGYPHLWMLRK